MTPTPLPEQGGFNERLTEILSNFWHYQNDHGRDRGITFDEAKAAIRTLVLEDIINHDPANRFNCEALRAEQRRKLEGNDD